MIVVGGLDWWVIGGEGEESYLFIAKGYSYLMLR